MWAFGFFGFIAVVFIVLYTIDKAGWHYLSWQPFDWGVVVFVSLFLGMGYYLLMCYYVQAWCIRWEGRQIARQGDAIKAKNEITKSHAEVKIEADRVEELKKERKLREEADIKVFTLEKKVKELEQHPLIVPVPVSLPPNLPKAEGSPVIHPITMELPKTDAKPNVGQ